MLVMPGPPRKRKGTARETVAIFARVDPVIKAKWDAIVAATGGSHVLLMEELITRMELDEHGRPVWWSNVADQEELPLKSA